MNRAAGESLSKDKRKDDVEQSFRRDRRPEPRRYNPIGRDTLLPLGILIGLIAAVVALTLHTSNKKRVSP